MVLGEKTVRELIYLLGLAVIAAFLVNYFSPKGIALKGSWDVDDGVITAFSKENVVVHEIEIQSVMEAKRLYDENESVFVDARISGAFLEGRIKGAVSLSVYDYDDLIDDFVRRYSFDRKMITYCSGRECDESHLLASFLKEEGYMNVRVFIDGLPEWEKKGFPVEK